MDNANQIAKPRAVVFCATFFDYYKDIVAEFERRGLPTIWLNTWLYSNSTYKLLLRTMPRLTGWFFSKEHISRILRISPDQVAEVLVIKGEGITPAVVAQLRAHFSHARLHLYLWDGIENTPHVKRIFSLFDSVSTFDPLDSRRFGWRYRPLFARPIAKSVAAEKVSYEYDFNFIGSLHSDRFKVLQRLLKNSSQLKTYIFGYIPGKLAWWLRHLTDLRMFSPGSINISTEPINFATVTQITESSRSVLDIEHPKQRGLTMRSIETLMLGRKLITTNQSIRDSDLCHESRVCLIDRNNPIIPSNFLQTDFEAITPELRAKYTIKTWLDDVLLPHSRSN